MNKRIKELYNKMNQKELCRQFYYLNDYYTYHSDELNTYEIRAILEQRAYVWRLRKSLEMVNKK